MSDNRKKCFDSIVNTCGCSVELVMSSNIEKFIVSDAPIHEGYQYLSLTHKADYLRAYLMYYYGGGYTDIKFNSFNWQKMFEYLNNTTKEFVGYAERRPDDIASNDTKIKNSYASLPGVCHFIFKQYTQIAQIWLNTVHLTLSQNIEQLKNNPGNYHPRAIKGGVFQSNLFNGSLYPFGWNQLLGTIFHKICYENMQKYDLIMPYPTITNYR